MSKYWYPEKVRLTVYVSPVTAKWIKKQLEKVGRKNGMGLVVDGLVDDAKGRRRSGNRD